MSQAITVRRILQYLLTGTIAIVVSTTWELTWRLAHVMENAKYFVLASLYLGAAGTVLLLMLAVDRRYPRMSMKMLQASITIGFLAYFMPGLTTFYSMNFMSPGVAVLTTAMVPLWLCVYKIGNWKKKVPGLVVATLGIFLFYYGSKGQAGVSPREMMILFVLLVSSFLYSSAIAFVRKIFWMHYGLELNFWAMLFSSCLLGLTSFLFAENRTVPADYEVRFLICIAALSVVINGAGTFYYRYVAAQPRFISTMTLTLGIPLLGIAWSWILGASGTPLSPLCFVGMALVLGTLLVVGIGEASGSWMTHFLTNTRRIGERVVCHMKAFVKMEKGSVVQIDVCDLSIGGMGYHSEQLVTVGDIVLVTIPLGAGWTQLSVEAKVVHAVKVPHPQNKAATIWHGGLMFINMPEERLQPFVEFVAIVGRSHDNVATDAVRAAS